MLAMDMLDDEGNVTETVDAEFKIDTCEDCVEDKLCYVWETADGMRFAVCAEHLARDEFARLAVL